MSKLIAIGCAIAVASGTILPTQGGELCAGESEAVAIDLTTGIGTAVIPERIRYSSQWVDGAASGAEAVVEVNGETLTSMVGSGAVTWTPTHNGNYTLTHKVMSGGA